MNPNARIQAKDQLAAISVANSVAQSRTQSRIVIGIRCPRIEAETDIPVRVVQIVGARSGDKSPGSRSVLTLGHHGAR